MLRNVLHVVDELAGVVSIGYGMADEHGNRYLHPPVHLEIFPEFDEREKECAFRISVLCKGGKAQPRQA